MRRWFIYCTCVSLPTVDLSTVQQYSWATPHKDVGTWSVFSRFPAKTVSLTPPHTLGTSVNNPVGDTIDSHKSLTSPPQTCWKSTFFPAAGPDMPRNKSQKKFYWDLLLLLYLFPVLVMFQKVFWWILSGKNFHYTARKTDTRSSPTDVRHKSQEEIKDMTNHCNIVTNIIVTF